MMRVVALCFLAFSWGVLVAAIEAHPGLKDPVVTDVKVEYGKFYNSISERDAQPFRFCSPVLATFSLQNVDLTKDFVSIRRTAHIVTEKNDNGRLAGQTKPKFSPHLRSVEYSPSADDVVCDGKDLKIKVRDCAGPSALSVVGDPSQYPMFFKGLFDLSLVFYPQSPGDAGVVLAEVSYETSSGKLTQTDKTEKLYKPAEIVKGPHTYKHGLRKWVESSGGAPHTATDRKHYYQCIYNLGSHRRSGHDESDAGELDDVPCPVGCKRSSSSSSSSSGSSSSSRSSGSSSSAQSMVSVGSQPAPNLSLQLAPASMPLFSTAPTSSAAISPMSARDREDALEKAIRKVLKSIPSA